LETVLSIKGLTKNFGRLCAVNNITLRSRAARFSELGPNGSGKTTTLGMLMVLLIPRQAIIHGLESHRTMSYGKKSEQSSNIPSSIHT
jgi:ABC-type multidrug transport system ATPase subunit